VAPYKLFKEIRQGNIATISRNQILLSKLTGASALLARQTHQIARIIAQQERSTHCDSCRKLEMQGGGRVFANHAPEHTNTMITVRAAIHRLRLWILYIKREFPGLRVSANDLLPEALAATLTYARLLPPVPLDF
jgi:hypothetical protein